MLAILESISQEPEDPVTAIVRLRLGDQSVIAFCPSCDWSRHQVGSEVAVEFGHLEGAVGSIEDALAGNPGHRKALVWQYHWRYDGFGEIVAVDPVVADFGPLTLELGDWGRDPALVGRYLRWPIDRLDVFEPLS